MKKLLPVLVLCAVSSITFGQEIAFSKTNYADSLSLAKTVPPLASLILDNYADNKAVTNDYRFRLQVLSKRYSKVKYTLNQLAQEMTGDSIKSGALGLPYKLFAELMLQNPSGTTDFRPQYSATLKKLYKSFTTEDQSLVDFYFDNKTADFKTKLDNFIATHKDQDQLSLEEALLLCRVYTSYMVFAKTSAIAVQALKELEQEAFTIDENITIPMSDGGTIAIAMAKSNENTKPLPVVMLYNIYAGNERSDIKEMARRGYVGIVANTRGKRLSPDAIEPFEHDAQDAYEIIDWLSKQPWCNGKVGMYGGSYLGFSQWSAVKKVHPALKTIVPQVSVGIGIDYPMHNGIFMNYMLQWIHYVSDNKLINSADFSNDEKWKTLYSTLFQKGLTFRSLDQLEGHPNVLFQRWLQHPTYDSYWQKMTPQKEEFAAIDIPILTTTGYYDDDQVGAMYYYHQYQKWNKNNNYYLLIGPYDHGGAQGYPKANLPGYAIDEAANIPIQNIIFEWFDYTLKGMQRPALLKDKVNFEVMGKNEWKHVATFEEMHNASVNFHLGELTAAGAYTLTSKLPKPTKYIAQTIDFKDRSDLQFDPAASVCGFESLDITDLKVGNNRMVFESEPFNEPIAISGALTASLNVSCNKKDFDISIQLYEKKANGHYFPLTNNFQRASLAKDRTQRQLLVPNTITTIPIESTYVTCKQLEKGSRIVILLGVNRSASWQVNYGTGKDVSDESIEDAAIPLEVKWYANSTITIPLLKESKKLELRK